MLNVILMVVVGLVVVVLVLALLRPPSFRVERSASIKAPPEKIFALINDFHHWSSWSPWEKMDLNMKRTHSGAASGKGAVYAWVGNKKVGTGEMEITESAAPARIVTRLDFLKPFEAHNTAEFNLETRGDSTSVTWSIYGPAAFFTRVMTVFVSMDKMMGKDFEAGLANIKALAEK
jgi:uncharacterized protein YndB with AHSA1/START domain